MRKIILIWLFTVFIASLLFSNGNYETVATINIGDGPDEFLIKHVAECREYPIKTYITPQNEFCILFSNNNLIRKYSPDFSSFEIIPVSDSLTNKYSNSGDVEFIEAFMVGEDNDVWYYFWSYKPGGSTIIHQNIELSIDIYTVENTGINLPQFIEYKGNIFLYGDWYFEKNYIKTSICVDNLVNSSEFIELTNMQTDSIYPGMNTYIKKDDTEFTQIGRKVYISGSVCKTINLLHEGQHKGNQDFEIRHLPEINSEGNIITLLHNGKSIEIIRRKLI